MLVCKTEKIKPFLSSVLYILGRYERKNVQVEEEKIEETG